MSKKASAVVVLIIVLALAVVALVFLYKVLSSPQGAEIYDPASPIWFAPWVCSCRAWCGDAEHQLPYGGWMTASMIRDSSAIAATDCLNLLQADCDAVLVRNEIISCRQVQPGFTIPVDSIR
jgi:hypothetical protein